MAEQIQKLYSAKSILDNVRQETACPACIRELSLISNKIDELMGKYERYENEYRQKMKQEEQYQQQKMAETREQIRGYELETTTEPMGFPTGPFKLPEPPNLGKPIRDVSEGAGQILESALEIPLVPLRAISATMTGISNSIKKLSENNTYP